MEITVVLSIFINRSIDIHEFSENHIFKNKVAKDPLNTIYFLIQKYWNPRKIGIQQVLMKLQYTVN